MTRDPGQFGATEAPTTADSSDVGYGAIGPYRMLQKLGEGGMGEVWLAEQIQPVRRRVALKLVKAGMDTAMVMARFASERQALALMDHPNIAKVYDGGSTEEGRPYFVMEYVRGEPINEFSDHVRLPLRQRLELFISLCAAVQHAHQKGIIHRDLKPSNLLVSRSGDEPIPRIIDFGIAKAMAGGLTDAPLHTELGSFIGTPDYISPEQAAGSADIDTRTDIYSLGVVLYELLTGSTPFQFNKQQQRSFIQIHNALQTTPQAPSRRLRHSPSLADTAARRSTHPRTLVKTVHGELDWLVLKAIDADRARRYETADALARDIRRYLNHEPIAAARPSLAYTIRKFAVRHAAAVTAGFLAVITLIAGLAGTLWQASVAAQQRDAARREAENARAVTDFVIESLEADDPTAGGRQGISVADAMKQAVRRLDSGSLRSQPDISAVLARTIASVLNGNGHDADARPLAERSLTVERSIHRGDHEHVAASLHTLAGVHLASGQAVEAARLAAEAISIRSRIGLDDSVAQFDSLHTLASAYVRQSKFAEAVELSSRAVELARRLFPQGDLRVARSLNLAAVITRNLGDLPRAEALYMEALATHQKVAPGDHPDLAVKMLNLGAVRRRLGKHAEAESMLRSAIDMSRRLFAGDHPTTAGGLLMLGQSQFDLKKLNAAESSIREAIVMAGRLYAVDHPLKVAALGALADVTLMAGQLPAAENAAQASLAMNRRLFKGDHVETLVTLQRLARIRAARGQWPAAIDLATEAAAMAGRIHPRESPQVIAANDLLVEMERRIPNSVPEK